MSAQHTIAELVAAHKAAWDAWEALHDSLPVLRRTLEQSRQLDAAYTALSRAKFRLDMARLRERTAA